jgi:hypothetical protein
MGSEGCKYSDIIITPDHLNFETQERPRLNPPAQDIFIKKDGHDLSPSWDAHVTTQGPLIWLKLKPLSGKAPKRVRVFCKSIGMPPGEWSGQIEITSHVKVTPSIIPVKLNIKAEEPPQPPPEPPEPPEPPPEPPEPPQPPPEPPEPPEPPPKPPPEPPDKWSWLRKLIEWLLGLLKVR